MSLSLTRRARRAVATTAAVLLLGPLGIAATGTAASAATNDWLHTDGNQIVDADGNPVWLTGTNWFGFNASERVFHGLWSGNITQITESMADRGINIVRVPISVQLLLEWKNGQAAPASGVNTSANPELAGKTTLQVFDYFLDLCEANGLKVMLDVHSAEADNSGHNHPVWWKGTITTQDFYSAWEWFATRYKNDDTVVAYDLKNEPHGQPDTTPRAKWDGSTDADNWRHVAQTAANKILAINPNALILVEGVEAYPKEGYTWASPKLTGTVSNYYNTWWGGNLRGVAEYPIDLGANQDQLVYSPHDYGPLVYEQPWFSKPFDKASLTADVWRPNWLYIHEEDTAPLLVGEWGGRLGQDERQDRWMFALRDLMIENRIHHTFWVLNPNSGDTGGLLLDDWKTWDEAKYAMLKPSLWQSGGKFVGLDHDVPLGGTGSTTGISLGTLYGGNNGGDTTAPSVPARLASSARTSTSVSLTWAASTDNAGGSGVAGYDVYQGTTRVGSSTTTSFTVTGLTPATAYSFTVRAKDAAGNVSAASTALNVSTTSGTATDTVAPSVPTGLTGTATPGSVTLSWAASTDNVGGTGVAGYDVYQGTTRVGQPTTTSFTVNGLEPLTSYTFTVRARDVAGNVSAASTALTVETAMPPEPVLGNLQVDYRNNDSQATDNAIRPGLRLVNTGDTPIDLSTVTVRYWFTRDGSAPVNTFCDWAQVGCANIRTRVVNLATPGSGADAYLEVSFASGALAAGASTGEIQLRLHKSDWSAFTEANDYSRGTGTSYAESIRITAYVSGTLATGAEPV